MPTLLSADVVLAWMIRNKVGYDRDVLIRPDVRMC